MTDMMDFDDIRKGLEWSEEMLDRGEEPFFNDLDTEKKAHLDYAFQSFLSLLDEEQLTSFHHSIEEFRGAAFARLIELRSENIRGRSYERLPLHPHRTDEIYQVKATLVGIRPPIWRRLSLPSDMDFESLHYVLLEAFGWSGYHLYMFEFGKHYECETLEDKASENASGFDKPHAKDAKDFMLGELLEVGSTFRYWYDFGDDWCVKIEVEKLLDRNAYPFSPYAIKMVRNAPPEDVGGPGGYELFLEAIQDSAHEMHDEMLDWYEDIFGGGVFDPESTDIDELNRILDEGRVEGIKGFFNDEDLN